MKSLILFLVLFPVLLLAQPSSGSGSPKVEIACFPGNSGEFSYSPTLTARLLTDYLGNAVQVANSRIEKTSSGSFVINADVFYTQGWGSMVITLEKIDNRLYITENSCLHQCIPNPNDPCVYKSVIDEMDPCATVTCSCVGAGDSTPKVTVGETRGLLKASLANRTVAPRCD